MGTFPHFDGVLPQLSVEQMIEVDRLMIEDYHIELLQMMENAGRNLALLARELFLDKSPEGKNVIVLAGTGGNGGGALVSARHLHNYGASVAIYVTKVLDTSTSAQAHQLDILRRIGITIHLAADIGESFQGDLIIDGIIGYNLVGAPRGAAKSLITCANRSAVPILALDIPSGIDSTSGLAYEPAIRASATMTLALPKQGLFSHDAGPYVGELFLADISVPPALYGRLGLNVLHIFQQSEILHLW